MPTEGSESSTEIPSESRLQTGPQYIDEETLEDIRGDQFDHDAYIDLLEAIIKHNGPNWHIGLFGTWGSGKSSIVELLFERIHRGQRFGSETDGQAIEGTEGNPAEEDHSRQEGEAVDDDPSKKENVADNTPNFDFPGTTCVTVDAWRHDDESIRTGILLDLNEGLAAAICPGREEAGRLARLVQGYPLLEGLYSKIASRLTCLGAIPAEEFLDSDEVIHELHDIKEVKRGSLSERTKSYLFVFFRQALYTGFLLGLILFVIFYVLPRFFNFTFDQASKSSIIGVSVFISAVFTGAMKNLFNLQASVNRAQENPRQNWAGSYERLLDEIIDKANRQYQIEYGEELSHLVIAVDDLDRCESETVYSTLIALKSFLEREDCTYIVPCDEDALYQHIKAADKGEYLTEQTNQRDFLAKFFETQIRIAEPTRDQLEDFAESKLDMDDIDLESSIVDDVFLKAHLRTPRRIIQSINRALTMQHLVEERNVKAIDIDNGAHVKFLSKIAVLQEDYPAFHNALVKGEVSLRDLVDPEGNPGTTVPQLVSDLHEILAEADVSDAHLRRLASFLIETNEIYQPTDPYLRLLGDEVPHIKRFEEAFDHERHDEVARRIAAAPVRESGEDDEPTQTEYLEVITDRLDDDQAAADAFQCAISVHSAFDDAVQEKLGDALFDVLDERPADRSDLLDEVNANDFELLLSDEGERGTDLLMWNIDAAVTRDRFDKSNLQTLFQFVDNSMQEQFLTSDLQTVRKRFARNLVAAQEAGTITMAQYQQIVDTIRRQHQLLYSRSLIEEGVHR